MHNQEQNRERSLTESGRRSDLLYNFSQDVAKTERGQNKRAETLAWAGLAGQGLLSGADLLNKNRQANRIKQRTMLYR